VHPGDAVRWCGRVHLDVRQPDDGFRLLRAVGRAAARDLAHQVRASLRRDLPGRIVGGLFVLSCRTFSGPVWTPYDNTNLRRFTYSAEFRLQEMP
jgi:hypothetical protein